jgi:hypothetical protein
MVEQNAGEHKESNGVVRYQKLPFLGGIGRQSFQFAIQKICPRQWLVVASQVLAAPAVTAFHDSQITYRFAANRPANDRVT